MMGIPTPILAAGALVAFILLRKGGAMSYKAPQGNLRAIAQRLNSAQLENVDIIEHVFVDEYGLSPSAALAAVINAIAESALNPLAAGDCSSTDRRAAVPIAGTSRCERACSIGLFQCNMCGGAGDGHEYDDLIDPWYNTRLIARVATTSTGFMTAYEADPDDVVVLTEAFTIYVERPANKEQKAVERSATIPTYFRLGVA